jgi:hypothetical protein
MKAYNIYLSITLYRNSRALNLIKDPALVIGRQEIC